MKNPLLDLLHDTSHDIGRILRHVEFIENNSNNLEKLNRSLNQIKISTKDLQSRLDEYYKITKNE